MADLKSKFLKVYSVLKEELIQDPAFEYTDSDRQWVHRVCQQLFICFFLLSSVFDQLLIFWAAIFIFPMVFVLELEELTNAFCSCWILWPLLCIYESKTDAYTITNLIWSKWSDRRGHCSYSIVCVNPMIWNSRLVLPFSFEGATFMLILLSSDMVNCPKDVFNYESFISPEIGKSEIVIFCLISISIVWWSDSMWRDLLNLNLDGCFSNMLCNVLYLST